MAKKQAHRDLEGRMVELDKAGWSCGEVLGTGQLLKAFFRDGKSDAKPVGVTDRLSKMGR